MSRGTLVTAILGVPLALVLSGAGTRAEEKCALGVYFAQAPALQVTSVAPDSPAAKAGVKAGDIIGAVNGVFVFTVDQLAAQLRPYACGDDLVISIVNIVDSPVPRPVHVQLGRVDLVASEKVVSVPTDYPRLPPLGRIAPLTTESATSAAAEAATLKKHTKGEFERGYYLGHKNFEGEGAKKFWSSAMLGVQMGKAELRFYLMTPYTEARFKFYESQQQFENLDSGTVLKEIGAERSGFIVVLQNAAAETLAANLVGWGSLATNTDISKVVIRRGGTVYPSIGTRGAGWAFPLELFEDSTGIEVIAVSRDNLHATIQLSSSKLKSMR